MMELLHNFLQFFISYSMSISEGQSEADIQTLSQQLESLYRTDENKETY
jgi:hypothetical protein